MKRSDTRTLEIFIHNLSHAQAIAIEDMLAKWQQGGSLGCSRWTRFYADGDGDFHPTCVVNGHVARHQTHVPAEKFWTEGAPWHGDYRIDYDAIAWALRRADELAADGVNSGSASAETTNAVAMTDESPTPDTSRR